MACTALLCLNPELTVFEEARRSKDYLWSERFLKKRECKSGSFRVF